MRFLAPLAFIYAQVMRLRHFLYQKKFFKQKRLPGFVISVGNLEVGGTGKSPVVMALCKALLDEGAQPAVLTRGYKSGLGSKESLVLFGRNVLLAPEDTVVFHADEARMQASILQCVPIIVGAQRYRAAMRYLLSYPTPTHWILDDGFQHQQIFRDLDLVLLDAGSPFDNGLCLPAGRLREPTSALKRADQILFTRAGHRDKLPNLAKLGIKHIPTHKIFFEDGPLTHVAGPWKQSEDIDAWGLALGIARPERVIDNLKARGFNIVQSLIVQDHCSFEEEKLQGFVAACRAVVTTEKDFWRSPPAFEHLGIPVFVIPLQIRWESDLSLRNLFRSLIKNNSLN